MKNNKQLTTTEFIERCNKIHNNKYDYSKTLYKTMHTKVCIVCPNHGEFWQFPENHLKYINSCPECQKIEKYNKLCNEFESKARKIHGNKYDYSKVNYIDYLQKVCIICPEHGEFWLSPAAHLTYKNECPQCAANKRGFNKRIGLDKFIKLANIIHNNKYDYSKFEYKTNGTKSIIICPEHGEFLLSPNSHLSGSGCPECGNIKTHDKLRIPLNEYIEKCNKIHNNKYDYSKVTENDYKNGNIHIICPIHGEFILNKKKHLYHKHGCPFCYEPTMEKQIETKLLELNINYEKLKKFDWLKYKQSLKLDFYLPDYNVAIECLGILHFVPTFYNKKQIYNKENYIKNFLIGLIRDNLKYNLCIEHNIPIYYFSNIQKEYKHKLYNNIDDMLNDIIETNLKI